MISNPRRFKIQVTTYRFSLYEYWKSCYLVGLVDNKKQSHTQIVTEREIFENVNRILSFGTSCKVKHQKLESHIKCL